MPTYIFSCSKGHSIEKFKKTPYRRVVRKRCAKCGLWATRDYVKEHAIGHKTIYLDYKGDPISHLARKRTFRGIWIENLTPQPVFVKSKEQYDKLLKDTHSREARG